MIKPASEGTGIIAGGPIRKMMDLVGISNVLSKSLGTNNRLNVTKATYKALTMLRERPELETDVKKGQKKEEKGAPQVKVMSKKEATEKVHADKRKGGKASAGKAPSSKKAE
jgi:ribosomal protein S5